MRTLLVDDHALVLAGLEWMLSDNGIEVVGTASNGSEAFMKFEMLKPELVLMDIQMADCDGIETTRRIRKEYPEAKIVMLTAFEDDDNLLAAVRAGAEGYLLKGMEPEDFIRQIAGIDTGETLFAPGLAQRLLREFSRRDGKAADNGGRRALTDRQGELLQLLAQGLTYKEIADQLKLKKTTVKYHVKEILAKLRLVNRTQLIAHASAQGLAKEN
jgi:DNA-binding NarL/FixJ family response regulator